MIKDIKIIVNDKNFSVIKIDDVFYCFSYENLISTCGYKTLEIVKYGFNNWTETNKKHFGIFKNILDK